MFDQKDFEQIDKEYFEVLNTTASHIILKSKNTRQTWDLYYSDWESAQTIQVFHKHNDQDSFHVQRKLHPGSVDYAQRCIKKHDDWYLKHKKRR